MDDSVIMSGLKTFGDLPGHIERVVDRHPGAGADQVGEHRPIDQLHHQPRDSRCFLDAVYLRDVLVVQGGDNMGFAFKTGDPLGVRCKLWREDLDGDVPVEPSVAGTIDLAHSAASKRYEDFVRTEACAGGERQSRQSGRF